MLADRRSADGGDASRIEWSRKTRGELLLAREAGPCSVCHQDQTCQHPYLRLGFWLQVFGCGEVGGEPLFGIFRLEGDFVEEFDGTDINVRWGSRTESETYSLISSLTDFAAAATRYRGPSSSSESSASSSSPKVNAKFSSGLDSAHAGGASAMLIWISHKPNSSCQYTYSVYDFSMYGSRVSGFWKSWTRLPRWRCLDGRPWL